MSKTGTDASRMRFGDFELRREIGRGGMGTVYEAWQRSLQRVVALKIMGGHVSSSATAVLRFQREAQAAAKLQHSNIIPIYAQGDEAGVYYYAMEYVQGRSLNHVIAEFRATAGLDMREPDAAETVAIDRSGATTKSASTAESSGGDLPSPSASGHVVLNAPSSSHRATEHFQFVAQHMAAVADALDYAHKRGVIHRDIKPHNLILGDDGRMRVSDFGLARLMEQPGVTMTGEVIGSPLYMAPEQIAGGPGAADHRADIYSLGATMYEWIALVPPYPGETRERVISMILTADSPSPRAHNPQIPVDLETICNKAIERDPARRYQTAADLRDDLHRFLSARPIHAKRAGLVDRSRRFVARHPLGTLAVAAACVALALSAALYSSKKSERKQSALLQEEKEKTKQIVEEADRVWSALQLASGAVLPEPMAEKAGPMLQNLFQSGQRIAGGTGGFSRLLGPSAAPFTPLGIAERAAVDLFSELRPKSSNHSENTADMAGQLFGQALAMWPANMATALSTVEVILNVKKDDFDARHYHAALSAGLKNFAGIANDGEELIRMRSNDAIGFLWRGIGRLLLDDAKSALADFEKAIDLNPTSMWSRALRGLSLIRMGRPMDALAEFDQVLITSPQLVVALMGRANAHRAIGNMPQALADLTRVIELEPQNADALAARSEVHRALSNVVEAEEDLRKVMELTGASPTLLMQLLLEQAKMKENTVAAPPSPPVTDPRINAEAQPPQPPTSDKSSRNAPLVAPWRRPSPEPPAYHGVSGAHRFRFLGAGW